MASSEINGVVLSKVVLSKITFLKISKFVVMVRYFIYIPGLFQISDENKVVETKGIIIRI